MPLTDNGWEQLEPDAALAAEQTDLKTIFGQEIDLSPHAPFGKLAQKEADKDVEIDQQLEMNYDAAFISQSDGVSLDRNGDNLGIQRNLSQNAVAYLTVTGTPGYVVPADTEFMTEDGTSFDNADDTQLDADGNGTLTVYSEDTAAYVNVDANTITVQAEPVEDIFTVTNEKPATGGADLETDYDYRRRLLPSKTATENGTRAGLKVAMLNVTGVTDAQVIPNTDDTVDQYGNPPHCIHIYVMGGQPDAIAQKIVDVAGAETLFVGKTVGNAVDDGGHPIAIHFDQEELVNVKFKITIQTNSEVDEDAVKQSILDYTENLTMGDPVILNQLFSNLYQTNGVDYVAAITAGTGDTLGTDNITMADYQLAHTDEDLITLEVKSNASA